MLKYYHNFTNNLPTWEGGASMCFTSHLHTVAHTASQFSVTHSEESPILHA